MIGGDKPVANKNNIEELSIMKKISGLNRLLKLAAIIGGVALLYGCDSYNAQVLRTEGGIPHIIAKDFDRKYGFATLENSSIHMEKRKKLKY